MQGSLPGLAFFFVVVINVTAWPLQLPSPLQHHCTVYSFQADSFMEIIGYFAASLIGVSLGLIGGGGSILTVPVLVYLFGVDPVLATAYSLFIVGSTSLVGAFQKYQQGLVDVKTAVIFGIPAILAVYATRAYLVPMIPNPAR